MIYSYWDIECDRLKLVVMGPFFPFTTLKTKKNQNQKKKKEKLPDISSFYTSVPKTSILSGTVPQIQSETDNFLSFWLIFCLFSANNLENQNFKHVYLKSRSYDVCFLRYRVQQTSCHLGSLFPLSLLTTKTKIWKKCNKPWRYYHFTHVYHKDHMMHGSWALRHDRQNFFSFWTIFLPFNPLNKPKIKILKKWKKHLEISSFDTCLP